MNSTSPSTNSSVDPHMSPGVYQHYKGGLYRLLLHGYVTHAFEEHVTHLLFAKMSEHAAQFPINVTMNWENGRIEAWLSEHKRHAKYPDGSPFVLYASLASSQFWLRPLGMWSELVLWPSGEEKPRFSWLGHDLPPKS